MNPTICDFIMQHSLLILIMYIIFHAVMSTAVHSLPAPNEKSSQMYIFHYTFLNAMFRNVSALKMIGRFFDKLPETNNHKSETKGAF